MAIMLFLRDNKQSTSQIRDYLRGKFQISESRGIRLHLEHLCKKGILEKEIQNGIGTHYFWKKNPESFKRIINFMSENNEPIRDILRSTNDGKKKKSLHDAELQKRLRDTSISFDATEFWYNTQYTKSLVSQNTLEHFVDKAYRVCRKERLFVSYCRNAGSKPTMEMFRLVFLENNDDDMLQLLMKYSPSLVVYVVNLEHHVTERLGNMHERKDLIFQLIVKDNLMLHYTPHGGGFVPVAGIRKITDKKGKLQRVDAAISYSFYPEHNDPLGFVKPKKVKARRKDKK